jgi:hypothetical protein
LALSDVSTQQAWSFAGLDAVEDEQALFIVGVEGSGPRVGASTEAEKELSAFPLVDAVDFNARQVPPASQSAIALVHDVRDLEPSSSPEAIRLRPESE